jgi:hypothetical protein
MSYGLVKTLDGVKMTGNALTFIIYKNYFGRDLLNDIVAFAKQNASVGTVKSLAALNVKTAEEFAKLSEEERTAVIDAAGDYKFDSEFILQFIAALIATARYPEKPDAAELITEIPPHWLADREVISEIMEFLTLFVKDNKAARSGGGL